MTPAGRVLVVDDNRTSRRKLGLAVKQLGHDWVEAENGASALAILSQGSFDLILLDIMMPEMDGFEVLSRLKASRHLAAVPVLVISGLDDDMESVVRAIELGAEDFLPKDFDPVLFKARVNTGIEKKRLRDRELDYLDQVAKLTDAAAILEGGKFHPKKLELATVAARDDALGRLARVFTEMAQQVYDRERSLQNNVKTLKGGFILLLVGLLWGLVVPLSRLISQDMPEAIGVSFWVELTAGMACCFWAFTQGKLKPISRQTLGFVAAWAILSGASTVLLFLVAGALSGIVISIIMALQGFIVFLFAAITRIEEPNLRRFLGLAVGLLGVLALLLAREQTEGVSDWLWIILGMAIPVLYGLVDLIIAAKMPQDLDMTAGMGIVLVVSAILILPLALWRGELFLLGQAVSSTDGLIVLTAALTAVSSVLYTYLVSTTGAVFASQSAYAITLAGIAWSILLLGETLTTWSVVALGLIIAGLALVGPKSEAADVEVEFVRHRAKH